MMWELEEIPASQPKMIHAMAKTHQMYWLYKQHHSAEVLQSSARVQLWQCFVSEMLCTVRVLSERSKRKEQE